MSLIPELRKDKPCQNCKKREGTHAWVGEGGSMAFVHGAYQMWCELCIVEAQIKHCRKELQELPGRIAELEKKLEELHVRFNKVH